MRELFFILSSLLILAGCNSSESNEIVKTSYSELNSHEKRVVSNLDSNKTYYLYEGNNKYLNLKFNSCQDNSCKEFNLLIENKRYRFGLNNDDLFIYYPNEERKIHISQVDDNDSILVNYKEQCENAISTDKNDALDLSNGDLPLCKNW